MGRAKLPSDPLTPEELFAGAALGRAVLDRVRRALAPFEPLDARTSRSQVALWRRHGFAYLWPPGRYVPTPAPRWSCR